MHSFLRVLCTSVLPLCFASRPHTPPPQQLEAVPLGKRVKQLRQHTNPEVQQQAQRVLKKLRQDVADACRRANKAKPILAKLKPVPKTSATLEG